jgi:hypothetical protein
VYLVLCSDTDAPALWAHQKLRDAGLAPIELVTSVSLALAKTWEHRLGAEGVCLNIDLGDGRTFCSSCIRGVLNRLFSVPQELISRAVAEDREYASGELGALYLSWLSALPGVINRPTPHGLVGSWRHASEWALLAAQAGLNTMPYRQSNATRAEHGYASLAPPGTAVRSVIVFQGELYGMSVSCEVRHACRNLAQSAATDLLGVDFFDSENGTRMFAHATPIPDLTLGGNELVAALAHALQASHAP